MGFPHTDALGDAPFPWETGLPRGALLLRGYEVESLDKKRTTPLTLVNVNWGISL